jgi:hypothetical protein
MKYREAFGREALVRARPSDLTPSEAGFCRGPANYLVGAVPGVVTAGRPLWSLRP